MRKKENCLIASFQRTEDALLCERICEEEGIGGRIIPVPGEIAAGCGHAYLLKPEQEDAFRRLVDAGKIQIEALKALLW